MHLIISCSLNKKSKSKHMAEYAYNLISSEKHFLDLQEVVLPPCDGNECYNHSIVDELKNRIYNARTIIIAAPIYNYDLNAVAKNLVELTGRSWDNKVVGFICAAGGKSSYMSPISFANSLMLDFRCLIIPRFVYADPTCFDANNKFNDNIKNRIKDLVDASIKLNKIY